MKELIYKGIVFDDYVERYDDGSYWAVMCSSCASKHFNLVKDNLDPAGEGICSVKGCHNIGEDADDHFYIDFEDEFVSFQER